MGIFTETKNINIFLPKIELKKRLKKVQISGVSRMPDPSNFYGNLTTELEDYYINFNKTLLVDFYFDYINTGSTKWIYFLLQHLEYLVKDGGLIEVYWKYDQDDESIELAGEVLRSKISIPFKLIPIENY